jgi:hypothetical protein
VRPGQARKVATRVGVRSTPSSPRTGHAPPTLPLSPVPVRASLFATKAAHTPDMASPTLLVSSSCFSTTRKPLCCCCFFISLLLLLLFFAFLCLVCFRSALLSRRLPQPLFFLSSLDSGLKSSSGSFVIPLSLLLLRVFHSI